MAGPIVETALGRVEGVAERGVQCFRGIPFARPPVGRLRFRPPEPGIPWSGVRPAAGYGPSAPQNASPLEQLFGSAPVAWDEAECLTLNIWTPAADGARRPVMVWVHGGAFVGGSGATPWYDGTRFAAGHDVVVVTLNYRLGVFGFLHLEDAAGEPYAGSGNVGILDQVAALRWVAENIAAFGGDPGNVTVFGESAGGMSVGTLLGLPAARGLFRRAVLQSGAGHNAVSREQAARVARDVLSHLGVDGDPAGRLAEVPPAALLEAQAKVAGANLRQGLAFQPVIDGGTLPALPVDSVRAGSASGVDVLVGTTRDEWHLFAALDPRLSGLDESTLRDAIGELVPAGVAADALDVYRSGRSGASPAQVVSAMMTDRIFRIPAIRLAEAHAGAGGRAFMYLFSWATPAFGGRLGSCHALEIPFVFANLDRPGVPVFCGDEPPAGLAATMNAAWARFARGGDPGGPGVEGWPGYEAERRATMVLDVDCHLEDDPMAGERRLWDGVL